MALRNRFAKSVENYISTSRVLQGGEEYDAATPEERAEIVARWEGIEFDLKNFYALKLKEAKDGKEREPRSSEGHEGAPAPQTDIAALLSPKSRGELMGRFRAEGKKFKGRDRWKRSHVDAKVPAEDRDEELERAIRLSVRETSRGDAEDDARVEMAIRASVNQLQADGGPLASESNTRAEGPSEETGTRAGPGAASGEVDLTITDEEYQELIERAIRQSTAATNPPDDEEFQRALERSRTEVAASEEERDAELQRAIEESRAAPPLPPRGGNDEDEELRKAIEASEREEADRKKAAKSEEEIVLEYVMRQSLREEEYKRAMREGRQPWEGQGEEEPGRVEEEEVGKGKGRGEEVEYEEDEEELRRAVEMSLKAGEQWGGEGPGPSSYGKG